MSHGPDIRSVCSFLIDRITEKRIIVSLSRKDFTMNNYQIILIIVSVLIPFCHLSADPPIFREIDEKNVVAIEQFLKTNNIDGKYGKDSLTLLNYAITTNNRKATIMVRPGKPEGAGFLDGMS